MRIQYEDISNATVCSSEVEEDAIMGLSLRPESSSAKRLQEHFPEYDPRASGDASEVKLIAAKDRADVEAHRLATKIIQRVCPGQAKIQYLTQPNATTKVGIVQTVARKPWPTTASSPRPPILPLEPVLRRAKTLIIRVQGVPVKAAIQRKRATSRLRSNSVRRPLTSSRRRPYLQPKPLLTSTCLTLRRLPNHRGSPT